MSQEEPRQTAPRSSAQARISFPGRSNAPPLTIFALALIYHSQTTSHRPTCSGQCGTLSLPPAPMSTARRKTIPHEVPCWVGSGTPFFITMCCIERGKNQLCLEKAAACLIDCAKFYHKAGDWHCRLFLLMPDHLHALASFPTDGSMKEFVRKFKIYTSRQCGVSWQRNFFDHRPRNATEIDQKAAYIRQNPVRAGLVTTAKDWRFCWESLDS